MFGGTKHNIGFKTENNGCLWRGEEENRIREGYIGLQSIK